MTEIPPRVPVSEKVFEAIFNQLEKQNLTPGMKGVRRGTKPAEIIFKTSEGEIPCQVKQDDLFIIFETPSGRNNFCAPKEELLRELFDDSQSDFT